MKKILIAITGGNHSKKAAFAGLELGIQLAAEIILLSVVDTGHIATEGGVTPKEMAQILKYEIEKDQQLLIDTIFKDYPVKGFVREGKPSDIILKFADECGADLIVIGMHGGSELADLLLGSVAEKVIRHSTKPVLVIPGYLS